ncbi:hypothetical protein B296_00042095 [Ensete ventricosum]|uniref:Uncharacterized protein n=1 Tax=Ensete ventricosum TaxID=4639 RepID=A0A426Y4D2_ENSVE|nr:hypothetical protein B296_00042095 [Ensete ventricosum]
MIGLRLLGADAGSEGTSMAGRVGPTTAAEEVVALRMKTLMTPKEYIRSCRWTAKGYHRGRRVDEAEVGLAGAVAQGMILVGVDKFQRRLEKSWPDPHTYGFDTDLDLMSMNLKEGDRCVVNCGEVITAECDNQQRKTTVEEDAGEEMAAAARAIGSDITIGDGDAAVAEAIVALKISWPEIWQHSRPSTVRNTPLSPRVGFHRYTAREDGRLLDLKGLPLIKERNRH